MNQGGLPPPPKTLFIATTFVRPTEITPKSVAHQKSRAAPDTIPSPCQVSGSVISSVQLPYQLLASGSPSSKLQGGVVHFRGSQRPRFPVEGKHERISVGFWPETDSTCATAEAKFARIQMRRQSRKVSFLPVPTMQPSSITRIPYFRHRADLAHCKFRTVGR